MRPIVSVVAVAACWSFAAAAEPVPAEMLGAWAKDGRCEAVSERLAITSITAAFSGGKPDQIVFYAHEISGRPAMRWVAEGIVSHVQYVAASDALAYYGMGRGTG